MTIKMYETAKPLELHRLSRQSLHKRYESDEEDVSESDAGGQDSVPSLDGSQGPAGAFDSDLSADEHSHADPDSDREEHLLAPFPTGKRPRPASMDTVKRISATTFADDAYVFDPEEDMVFELPSPDSSPTTSNFFLQPAIHVSPNSPPTASGVRSRSASPSSIFSVENAEIQVATKVTMVEPPTRPTLVFINSIGTRPKGPRSRSSHSRTRGTPRDRGSRMFLERTSSTLEVPRLVDTKASSSRDSTRPSAERKESASSSPAMLSLNEEPSSMQTTTIKRISEIPVLPYIPPSPRVRPQSIYRPRPRTAGAESPFPTLASTARNSRPTETNRQLPSIRCNSNSNVPSHPHSVRASPFPGDDLKTGYLADSNSDATSVISRSCSSISTTSPPPPTSQPTRDRTHGLPNHNMSNNPAHRPALLRRMTRKHSASSVTSLTSLRSEIDTTTVRAQAALSQASLNTVNGDAHVVRKSSQRRQHGRQNSSAFGGRGFMGLKIGKRAFTRS